MTLSFGWRKKAEILRMVILSGCHQLAKELPAGLAKILELFRRAAETEDGSTLQEEIAKLPDTPESERPLWEPIEVHGWKIQVTMYLDNGQLWWLAYARHRNENEPSENDIKFLSKILEHLGADPKRDMVIGPSSSPAGKPALPFGWWTWFNRMSLYEIQVNKNKKGKEKIRIVPLGAAETDGYQSLDDLVKRAP